MYRICSTSINFQCHSRDGIVWNQYRYMPRSRTNGGNFMDRNTAMSSVYLEDDPFSWTSTVDDVDTKLVVEQMYVKRKTDAEEAEVFEGDAEKPKDRRVAIMRARLRSKYQIYTDLPSAEADCSIFNGMETQKQFGTSQIQQTIGSECKSRQESEKEDFFGIINEAYSSVAKPHSDERQEEERKEERRVLWHENRQKALSKEEIFMKYWQPVVKDEMKSKEKVLQAPYGWIRMDEHGQQTPAKKRKQIQLLSDEDFTRKSSKPPSVNKKKHSLFDSDKLQRTETTPVNYIERTDKGLGRSQFIEEQYFPYDSAKNLTGKSTIQEDSAVESFIESQYFPENVEGQGRQPARTLTDIGQQYSSQGPIESNYKATHLSADQLKTDLNEDFVSSYHYAEAELNPPKKVTSVQREKLRFKPEVYEEPKQYTPSFEPEVHEEPKQYTQSFKPEVYEEPKQYKKPREASDPHKVNSILSTEGDELQSSSVKVKENLSRTKINNQLNVEQASLLADEVHEGISQQARRTKERRKLNLEEPKVIEN